MASFVRLAPCRVAALAEAYGGEVVAGADGGPLGRFVPLDVAGVADLAPLTAARFLGEAVAALAHGATLLVQADLCDAVRARAPLGATLWVHPYATWAMAKVLASHADAPRDPASVGEGGSMGPCATLGPRVVLGNRVTVGASCVIGSPGFGWAVGPGGERVQVPQLGGVLIEDDVFLGPLVTIDAGTLGPTIVRRGVKLDAHVHVGHNGEIGEGTIVAAQSGFAGSVKVGRRVLVGGQVGVADHVTIGDDARIAAKSGVIGDVPAGATVAGYPAVPRVRWLRGLAGLYRRRNESTG